MTKKFLSNVATYQPGAKTLPGEYYTSESIFTKEKEKLFAQHWNCVGRSSDIPKPGDYFLATAVGESLIIVRDSKGVLHAHFNFFLKFPDYLGAGAGSSTCHLPRREGHT